jgi:hypothetical protein
MRAIKVSLTLLALSGHVLAGQAPTRTANSWRVPRTIDGHPDIEGVWSYATLTPLERPKQFADKRTLSDEEAIDFARQILQDWRSRAGTAIDVFWLERGSVAVVDGLARTSLIVDPPDGRRPPLLPDAQKRVAARAEARRLASAAADLSLGERCLSPRIPVLLPDISGSVVRIVQTRDHVVLLQEEKGLRIVPINGRPGRSAGIQLWAGNPSGSWSGDTLVIDTTHFSPDIENSPYDQNLHLVERFTRDGPDTLRYEFTVDDPTAFTRPWTAVVPMRRTDQQIYEFACHEGNYSLPMILRGSRIQELEGNK